MLSKTLVIGSLLALTLVVLLVYNYGQLQVSYAEAQARYEMAKLRYEVAVQEARQSYQKLEVQYHAIIESFDNITIAHAALQLSNDQLSEKVAGMEKENALMQSAYNAKNVECHQFQSSLEQCLSSGAQSYQAIEALEGNVLFKGGNATVHFYLGGNSKHYIVYEVNALNYYVNEGYLNRRIIDLYRQGYSASNLSVYFEQSRLDRFTFDGRPQPILAIKTANGTVMVQNYMAFKDVQGVLSIADYILSNSADDSDFVKNVLLVKSQLNDYTFNIRGEPRYPLETFLEGGGDCGASSLFVGSVIKAAHPEWTVQMWLVDSDPTKEPTALDHFIIRVDNGRGMNLYIETTAKDPQDALNIYNGKKIYGQSFDF